MNKKIDFSKINITKILEYVLIFFLIIQPIFDLKIFYNSISTLIRVVIIFILFAFYFALDKNKHKYLFCLYFLVLFAYILFHHINALNFKSLVPGNFCYSLGKELLYFIKMVSPFLLIYVIYNSKLSTENLLKIVKTIVLFMGLTIIVSNLFLFSYSSYNDEIIKANFISWFGNSNNYTYQELSSKGLFEYANQISAVLLMFLPFCILSFIQKKSIINFLTIVINMLSLFLLGTKVAVFGVFIVFLYTIFVYLFGIKDFKIKRFSFYLLLLAILIYGLILPKNPTFMRINETKAIKASSDSVVTQNSDDNSDLSIETNIDTNNSNSLAVIPPELSNILYVEQAYEEKEIKEYFIKHSYPYIYDTEFWMEILNEPRINRVNYRFIEQSIIERIIEINNNKLDILFGISNTRIQNIFNIEKDFVVQYYALGVIGLLAVLGPYFALIGLYVYKMFKTKFEFSIIDLMSFITIIMLLGISYFSGNLLNSLSFTIYFSILFLLLFKEDKFSSIK